MVQRVVSASLKLGSVIMFLALAVVALGLYAYQQLDIEAYPNPVPPMIEILTQPSGWSAEEVERYVTIPLETGVNGTRDLDHIRSQSLFGLSSVKCYFTWDVDYYSAQQRIINRLQFIPLPPGMQPQLSPWNAIGEVYRYVLRGKGYTLTDLKTAQDWILEKQFRQVAGVIDVTSFGGYSKEYHVEVDPNRLRAQELSLGQLTGAIKNANVNVGGQRLTLGEQSFNVRGIGLIRSLRDIGNVVVASKKGVPIRVRHLAQVLVGHAPRLGIIGKDGEADVVQGIVLMRYGGDSMKTIEGIHQRVEYIRKNHILPPGMDIEPVYDRAGLVKLTTHTVLENMLVGMALVMLVLLLYLGNARAALITAVNVPLALLLSFLGMVITGTPANLISLGAVDFGIVVESTVIMVENIYRSLGASSYPRGGALRDRVIVAAGEVGPAMFSSTLIIGVAFLPLFTMTGVAGVIFSPMAHTYAFAIGGAVLLAMTLTPVLALRFLRPGHAHGEDSAAPSVEEEHESWLMRHLKRFYVPLFHFSLRRKKTAIALCLAPVAFSLVAFPYLGREFMPKLEEGNFWIRATLPTSISLDQTASYVGRMRGILLGCPAGTEYGPTQPALGEPATPGQPAPVGKTCDDRTRRYPEVRTVISQVGRPDDGTDVSGFNNVELLAPLLPRDRWRPGVTKEGMTAELSSAFAQEFPGVVFTFSQAISDNVEEAISGVKGENTVKVIGPDLLVNEANAAEIVAVMGTVKGVEDLGMLRSLGQPNVRITPDRVQCGRYGLNVGDVEAVVQAAIGGEAVTQVYEGEKHFDLTVRWLHPFRKDLKAIRNILVATGDGAQVPLGQLAEIVQEEGPAVIYREDNMRYTPVRFSVRGRDLASTIAEAQGKIAAKVKLPYDTHLEWAGEINQLNESTHRLMIILPITLLLIGFIVYSTVGSLADTLIVLGGIPVACSGGILALLITGTHFSISVAMGFISIFGIAVQDALIVVTGAQRLWARGVPLERGALEAAERGLRPVLMTASVALIGLLPAALSRGIGSETQKPLATVVIGGALILILLPRLLQPPLLVLCHRKGKAR